VKIKGGIQVKKLLNKIVSFFRPSVLKEKEEERRVSRSTESGVKMLHVLPSLPAPNGSRLSVLEELKEERRREQRREEFRAWKENLQAVYKIQKKLRTA
jgi:hypothetical protein